MTIEVSTPTGITISFPDGTTADVIQKTMAQAAGGGAAKPAALDPKTQSDMEAETAAQGLKGVPIAGAFVDQAGAGIRSAMHPLTGVGEEGGTFAERYTKNLKRIQEIARKYEAENPGAATTANVMGGAAALGGLGAIPAGARALGLTQATLPRMVGASSATGGAIAGADAAARGEPIAPAIGLGAGVGAAAPVVGRAVGAALEPLISPAAATIRGMRNPTEEATRRVIGAIDRDRAVGPTPVPGMPGAVHEPAAMAREFESGGLAGTPASIMDVGGETTRAVARSAANTSPEARAVLDRSINDRFEGQSDRITGWLNRTFSYPNPAATQEALDTTARTVNSARYQGAQREADTLFPRGMWSPELERLTSSPDLVAAMKDAATKGKTRAVGEGAGGFNPGMTFENGLVQFPRGQTGVPTYPDLRFWDYTYRNIRDTASEAFRKGRDSEGGALRTVANQLRTELDRMVPSFGQARAGAASFFGAENALEAGQAFVSSRLANDAARRAVAGMSDTERNLFRDGFVAEFVNKLREVGFRRNVLNEITSSPAKLERLQIALGPQRARELEAMLRVEGIMDMARGAVQGNSTTARQLTELGLAGGAYTIGTGGSVTSPDPVAIMGAALTYGVTRGKGRIDANVARRVAEMLTSRDPQVFRNAIVQASNPTYLQSLRAVDARLAQAGGLTAATDVRQPAQPAQPQPVPVQ